MKEPLYPFWKKTPLWYSKLLSARAGRQIYLKMETFQPTGSFKARGIGMLCQEHAKEGKTHIVAASGGNAGYAAAYAARKLGLKATIFVPKPTLELFKEKIREEEAEIVLSGDTFGDSEKVAKAYAQEHGGGYVPPYDHPAIWNGNSTLIDELVEQIDEKPGAIVVAVGGGGLLCGVLEGLHRHHWTDVPVLGMEPVGASAFYQSLKAGQPVVLDSVDTLCSSLASKRITQELWNWTKKHEILAKTVPDRDAVESLTHFLDDHRVLVEPACGVGLAAVYKDTPELEGKKSIVIVLCGGVGINTELLTHFRKRVGLIE